MRLFKPKHGRAKDQGWFLKNAKAESFGALSNAVIGPFGPGLNVVHGENEAGKTTFASLIGGVMFGWEDGRSLRNTYKPSAAGRSGFLAFARVDEPTQSSARLSRARNADGVQGDTWLLDDVDRETYGEIFSLNSDQLRGMGDAGKVTSRLLTAGAGTATSPTQVRADLDARIAEYTSRSEKYPHSITRLAAERDNLARLIDEARTASDALQREDAGLDGLRAERDAVAAELRRVNERISKLNAAEASVRQCEERGDALELEREGVLAEKSAVSVDGDYSDIPARLLSASPAEDAALRERLETIESDRESAREELESARKSYESSFAEYADGVSDQKKEEAQQATTSGQGRRTIISGGLLALAAIAFVVLGLYFSREDGNAAILPVMSLFACAGLFGVVAVVLAIVGALRSRGDRARAASAEEAQWLLEKEKARYEQAQAAWAQAQQSVALQLEGMGLRRADGSLRAAHLILDRAQHAREQNALAERLRKSLDARVAEIDEAQAASRAKKSAVLDSCGMPLDGTCAMLEAEIADAGEERESLVARLEEANVRIGQVEQRLAEARGKHDLDALRMQHQQVLTRLAESQRALAGLFLERRLLDEAVDEWKSTSQPEVYQRAERLLSQMTEGKWTRIIVSDDGRISVADEFGEERDPLLLSTGTCQQLYLALRIALLETAEFVGKNVPVICDDILVNFDERRRRCAAKALASLARSRQVILFTCHKDVVATLKRADPTCVTIDL